MACHGDRIGIRIADEAVRKPIVQSLKGFGFRVAGPETDEAEALAWLVDLATARSGFIAETGAPVVVLLDEPEVEAAAEMIGLGAADCWMLPYDPDGHGARLERLLGDARIGRLGTGYGLAALLAHEMKSPVVAVLQQVMALEKGIYGPLPERADKVLARMRLRLDGLAGLIDEWLLLSKSMYGKPVIARRLDLVAVIRDAALRVAELAEARDVAVRMQLAGGVFIPGDPKTLGLMVTNLLENGIKYNQHGGRVDVRLKVEHGQAVLEVSDTGRGIPPQEQQKVFQPFYRYEQRDDVEGSGLGLALIRAVAEAHGGQVSLESTPQRGSRFTVTLPFNTSTES